MSTVNKLDITREHCPMTFVKTRLELEKLSQGDRLEVLLSEGEPLDNVPKSAEELGYKVLSIEENGPRRFKVVIEK